MYLAETAAALAIMAAPAHHLPAVVTAHPGDTLTALAARYCPTAADYPGLAAASGIADPDVLAVGQRVVIACAATGRRAAGPAAQTAARTSYAGRHRDPFDGQHGYRCGDGDGDGDGDMPCSMLHHTPAPRYTGRHRTPRALAAFARRSPPGGAPAGTSSFEACVIARESGGNAQVMNASAHYGLYQFSAATWAVYGGSPGEFGHASAAEQRRVFLNAIARGGQSNWSPYDGCTP